MDSYTIFTNNSIVAEYFNESIFKGEIKWISAPSMEVLSAAKAAVHLGAVIISNPLSGVRSTSALFSPAGFGKTTLTSSSPPKIRSINPYLSILAEPSSGMLDFESVKNLEEAISIYKKNARLRFLAHNDDAIRNFQIADFEILLATITALKA